MLDQYKIHPARALIKMRIKKDKVNGMIELLGVNIKHKSFGVGKVIEQTDTYLKIEFPVGTKQFQFPEAFEKFLQCENSNIQNIVLEELAIKKRYTDVGFDFVIKECWRFS